MDKAATAKLLAGWRSEIGEENVRVVTFEPPHMTKLGCPGEHVLERFATFQ